MAALTAFAAVPALADPPPWAHGLGVYNTDDEQGPASGRGVIAGSIVGVDYSDGAMVVATKSRRVQIQVTPSTSIFFGNHGYATLSDLARGSRVEVFVSQIDGRLVAQIIRIK
ncbi:MAG: hypothetical protein GIW95_12105 [Candidatus Eremiobacteraeota bacterium]|nr:hypothetical protein [Candidatus Eremiobacteraeota bacterium]